MTTSTASSYSAPIADLPISVVICCHTFDRLPDTLTAIASISMQTAPVHEVIVSVDNNPPLADELRRRLPGSVTVVLNDGESGESPTRNVGIAEATGAIIAFLDDDARAEPHWLEHLLIAFRDPKVMVAGGQSVPNWERGDAPAWFPREFEFVVGCTGHTMASANGDVRNTTGSNMAVRASAFEELGGWNPALGRGAMRTGGGEAELCLRIKSGLPGARVVHVPEAIVHHKVPRERSRLGYVFPYAFNEGVCRVILAQRVAQYTGGQPLAGERAYLRDLLTRAIPTRVRRFREPAALAQLAVILTNIVLVGAGYVRGRLTYR